MSDHSAAFNLAMAARVGDSWYTHLPAVEAAMAEDDRTAYARFDAGWEGDEGGWYAPDGTHESDWEELDLPFPEDVAAYTAWFHAYYHYDALDNDLNPAKLDPYPQAPPHRRPRYLTPTP